MRFYVDECLSRLTAEFLRQRGHNATHVVDQGSAGRGDAFHYARARETRRILVTRDADFSNEREYPFARHPGVINVDLNPRADTDDVNEALGKLLRTLKPDEIKGAKITLRAGDMEVRRPQTVEIAPYKR